MYGTRCLCRRRLGVHNIAVVDASSHAEHVACICISSGHLNTRRASAPRQPTFAAMPASPGSHFFA